jgi:dipeptidyl aminopeptidase/acylaminoacyl peptidase
MKEILITSAIDGTKQPSLFHQSPVKNSPLLVGLHTWSFGRDNQVENLLPIAKELNWNLLLPEFRGPNLASNPQAEKACGSPYAKQDIIDAVNYIHDNFEVGLENVFLIGGSGGGHMALMMAAYAPKLWKAVAAFVPVCDLKTWYCEAQNYSEHIASCCGGEPEGESLKQYYERSPLYHIDGIAQSNVKIFHGKYDELVPYNSHSLRLYNELCEKHQNARVFLDIFDGGHEIRTEYAKTWFLSQLNYKQTSATVLTG